MPRWPAEGDSDEDSGGDHAAGVTQHEPTNAGCGVTKSEAQAEFAEAKAGRVGDDSVQAETGKDDGGEAEERDEAGGEGSGLHAVRQPVLHASGFHKRAGRGFRRGSARLRLPHMPRAHRWFGRQGRRDPVHAVFGPVDLRAEILFETVVEDVPDDADNLAPRLVIRHAGADASAKSLSDRVFLAEDLLCHCCVDKADARAVGRVGFGEETAANERNFHCAEVTGRRRSPVDHKHCGCESIGCAAFKLDASSLGGAGERKTIDESCFGDSRVRI